MVNIGVH